MVPTGMPACRTSAIFFPTSDTVRTTPCYENRSFLRLQDITLSYDLPRQWMQAIRIDGINIYVSGKNLLTFSGWHGWDPEPNITYQDINGQNRMTGSGYADRPVMKSVTFGININL